MFYQKNFKEVKYLSVSILKMLRRFSKIMTTIEDKSRPAAFVPYMSIFGLGSTPLFQIKPPTCWFSVFEHSKTKGGTIWWKKYLFSNKFSDLGKSRLNIFKVKTCIILLFGLWNPVHALCMPCLASLVPPLVFEQTIYPIWKRVGLTFSK